MKLDEHQSQSGPLGAEKNLFSLPKLEPQFLSHPTSSLVTTPT